MIGVLGVGVPGASVSGAASMAPAPYTDVFFALVLIHDPGLMNHRRQINLPHNGPLRGIFLLILLLPPWPLCEEGH